MFPASRRMIAMTSGRARQRGLSFVSLCILVVLIVFVGYVAVKSIPVASEYMSLKKTLKQAAQQNTVSEVRATYDRVASIESLDNYSNPVRSADLAITKVNDRVVVSVEYDREIPLFGPAYLVYRLNVSSE